MLTFGVLLGMGAPPSPPISGAAAIHSHNYPLLMIAAVSLLLLLLYFFRRGSLEQPFSKLDDDDDRAPHHTICRCVDSSLSNCRWCTRCVGGAASLARFVAGSLELLQRALAQNEAHLHAPVGLTLQGSMPKALHADKLGRFAPGELVNGRRSWLHRENPNVRLWWSSGRWWVGKLSEVGTARGWLKTAAPEVGAAAEQQLVGHVPPRYGWLVYGATNRQWLPAEALACDADVAPRCSCACAHRSIPARKPTLTFTLAFTRPRHTEGSDHAPVGLMLHGRVPGGLHADKLGHFDLIDSELVNGRRETESHARTHTHTRARARAHAYLRASAAWHGCVPRRP